MDKSFIQLIEELEKQFNVDYNIVSVKMETVEENYKAKISPKEVEHRQTLFKASEAHKKLVADLQKEYQDSIKEETDKFSKTYNQLYREREALKKTLAAAKNEIFNKKPIGN